MKQIEGKYSPSKSRIQSLFCLQVQNTHSFCRQQNGRIFTIFHQVDIYIYIYIYNTNAIPLSRHFAMKDHISNRNASFIITQQICRSNLSRVTKRKSY